MMNYKFEALNTPAFLYDMTRMSALIRTAKSAVQTSSGSLLFSTKAFAIAHGLEFIAMSVDGFATSSAYEAMLARDILQARGTVHMTTPGLRPDEVQQIAELCDFVTLNSLSQWRQFDEKLLGRTSCGLRINPQISFVSDNRYAPCRRYSKLGIPLDSMAAAMEREPGILKGIEGLHFHSNCDSSDFEQLLQTVKLLDARMGAILKRIRWINLGGGYLFHQAASLSAFYEAVDLLKAKYDLEVFVEPGASIVRDAGYVISTVLDIIDSEGKRIAILDTTVNHMPEVFEYQFEPDVIGHRDDGRFSYILAGCTCLAGDLFGEYAFDEPLRIGSQVVFANMGAYSLVKAHMFNGVNLPTIYALTESGELVTQRRFTYEDFAARCGADTNVTV